MLGLHRSRQMLIVAVIGAIGLGTIEFPFRQLMNQRSQIAQAAAELQAVNSHNTILKQDISSLSKSSTIAAIAHQEYGLVQPGQRSYVILPGAHATQNMNPLTALSIPVEDLGSTSGTAISTGTPPSIARPQGSLWGRVLRRLEFWH